MRLETPLLFVLLAGTLMGCDQSPEALFPSADSERPWNVVLISLDTLRADHLGCYGHERDTSPNIDRLAAESTLFLNAFSVAPKTAESHMSMFTSLYPSVHRVSTVMKPENVHVLDSNIKTLPEILQAAGFTTVGFHGGGFVHERFGFDRGFDIYEKTNIKRAREWLESRDSETPFFLFVHTYHVHDPYAPRPPYDTLFDPDYRGEIIHDRKVLQQAAESGDWVAYSSTFWNRVREGSTADVDHLEALYDGLIAELDASLGGLFSALERFGPRTVVILTSDHGEEFQEHGGFKHRQLYNETLRVPLIVKHPLIRRHREIESNVSLIGLTPTILEILSLPAEESFQGESWSRQVGRSDAAYPVFSEHPGFFRGPARSLILGHWKLKLTGEEVEFFNLQEDPGELVNLVELRERGESWEKAEARSFELLRGTLRKMMEENRILAEELNTEDKEAALDAEHLDQLKALGYIE